MLLKSKMNFAPGTGKENPPRVNIDGLRKEGTFKLTSDKGGGDFPEGVTFPVKVEITAEGDTQTLTDKKDAEYTRNFGLKWWGDWA